MFYCSPHTTVLQIFDILMILSTFVAELFKMRYVEFVMEPISGVGCLNRSTFSYIPHIAPTLWYFEDYHYNLQPFSNTKVKLAQIFNTDALIFKGFHYLYKIGITELNAFLHV